MNPVRITAVIRRHWLVLWRGPHRWFEIGFWPVMDAILWGSLGLYMSRAGATGGSPNATAVNLLLAGIVLFWTLTVVQMTMSVSIMDETNTRNLLNVLTTSVTPAEYLVGVAAFGLIKLSMTMTTLTVVTILIYGFSLASLGWVTLPIVAILIVCGWAVGFMVLGLMLRFGPSAEILTWGINYVLLSLSGVFFPASALPGGLGHIAQFMPTGLAFAAMRSVLRGGPPPWHDLALAALGSLVVLGMALLFCAWMLRVFRRRGFVTRYS
jgi:ABC-2 type transport system permease protein